MAIGRVFNSEQAARYLEIHKDTLLRAYRAKKVKGVKDMLHGGGPVIFTQEDLDAYRRSKLEVNIK